MAGSLGLLGRPQIRRDDGCAASPRGTKAWGLLAYLVLTDRPPSRRQLVALLFAEAQDPLGALRWNMSEARRALRGVATLGGDPVVLELAPGSTIDVRQLTDARRRTRASSRDSARTCWRGSACRAPRPSRRG